MELLRILLKKRIWGTLLGNTIKFQHRYFRSIESAEIDWRRYMSCKFTVNVGLAACGNVFYWSPHQKDFCQRPVKHLFVFSFLPNIILMIVFEGHLLSQSVHTRLSKILPNPRNGRYFVWTKVLTDSKFCWKMILGQDAMCLLTRCTGGASGQNMF